MNMACCRRISFAAEVIIVNRRASISTVLKRCESNSALVPATQNGTRSRTTKNGHFARERSRYHGKGSARSKAAKFTLAHYESPARREASFRQICYFQESGRVAQLVEQCPFKAWVDGSSPSALTRFFRSFPKHLGRPAHQGAFSNLISWACLFPISCGNRATSYFDTFTPLHPRRALQFAPSLFVRSNNKSTSFHYNRLHFITINVLCFSYNRCE